MRKSRPFSALLAMLFALLLVAAACGDDAEQTSAAADGDISEDEMSEMSDEEMADGHEHGDVIDVPEGMAVPSIEISAEPDTVSGHNLMIELTDFTVTPENASTDPVDGEGHLHLYVNGERKLRFYNTALHLNGLPEGDHEIEVEISANNHSAYAVDGEPIRGVTTVSVGPAGEHHHGGEDFESAGGASIDISITEDPKSGWNVFADVGDFTFAPENAGGEAVDGEGHLHLYVDGERVTRLYGPWWHLSGLEAGDHEVMIEVGGNDHRTYAVDGEPVMAMANLNVTEAQAMLAAGHGGDDADGHGGDGMEDGAMDDGDEEGHAHGGSGETLDIAAADADIVVSASLADGDLTIDERRIEVTSGQTVGITFESDITEQVHLHGYDILSEVGPESPADFAFLADSPGTFEVELEQSGRFLFEIQVR